ncbi:uncharacterized protein LOC123006374 [Tribolium madens]|uniref:uncharacterized protein LOC123006374 n=1 Tax=Tribolium madens TaxID=41895 RepID=UPI001CF74001|nr:uncharacterized protein LOC123006374 [Tribolium madens]
MHCVISRFVVLLVAFTYVSSTNILEFWNWGHEGSDLEQRDDNSDSTALRTCKCDGPSCMCCVDFNLTYIDLGGPGCVRMKYISQDEGIAVNVSYGESLLHSEQVKGPNPEPTCMALLANLAQVCARFSDLQPYNDGLRGCLLLEPKFLGDVTTSFNIGCFTMGPEGMKLEESVNSTLTTLLQPEKGSNNGTQNESEGLNEEELIAAVNESAEQGLVFFGNLLGLTFGKPETNETNTEAVTPATNTSIETSTSS